MWNQNKIKILFVCLGNICRSPLADGLLRRKAKELNINIEVDSAGTANYHVGEPPDLRMIETAQKRGTDLSFLRARQFNTSDFEKFDFIFVMDKSNLFNVNKLAINENQKNKVKLFLDEIQHATLNEVPDPFYGTQKDFDFCYDLLDEAIDSWLKKYKIYL